MKAISFNLSGKTAMFKKPDVNSYAYFTYNNIHKPALLGLLGAILGLGGYIQLSNQNKSIEEENKTIKKKADKKPLNDGYPEFYEKLKGLKIAITPLAPHGYFSKKIQVFNNSVGYASKEMGGNLIVREQWLENPKWQIMILADESEEYEKLREYLIDEKSVFVPYLGKNDHIANIAEVCEVELSSMIKDIKCSSLFIKEVCTLATTAPRNELVFSFQEVSPIRLQEEYHFYEYANLVFTNYKIIDTEYKDIYSLKNENYFFL